MTRTAPRGQPTDGRSPRRLALYAYIGGLAAAAVAVALASDASGLVPPGSASRWTLPLFAGLLVAAEYLFVRFRFRGEINALNLLEAVLAPLLFLFDVPVIVATMAIAQIAAGLLRRNQIEKLAFNVAQWAFAAAAGSAVFHALPLQRGVSWGVVGGIVLALAVVGIVNQSAFTGVIAIVERRSPSEILRGLVAVVPGWVIGWGINVLTGLLLVMASAASSIAVVLFPVPLIVLHLAYRGFAGARSDRVRLAGLPRASQALATPLDPLDGIEPYLREVALCFEASAASLILRTSTGWTIHRFECQPKERYTTSAEASDAPSIEGALMAHPTAIRVTAAGDDLLSSLLAAAGYRDCLSAPLMQGGALIGALLVLDQAGFEGFEPGELAVVESLARESAATLGRGKVVATLLRERRRLEEIVGNASDGIFTVDRSGVIRSWNPSMQKITGIAADEVVGSPEGLAGVGLRRPDGGAVDLAAWVSEEPLPSMLEVTPRSGEADRLLSCAYSVARDSNGAGTSLIVVARDMTPDLEMATLRAEFDRLSRAEAAHRVVVDRLQEAIMPPAPSVAATELGVRYLPSDPSAPTGGDLYDCQVLPNGDVYLSVVDVLGHGVSATKDALSVVHALRTLVLQDRPFDQVIAAADEMLRAHDADLVATVMLARFTPSTGLLRIAAGGHPPALVVSPEGGVRAVPAAGGAIGWPGAGSHTLADVTLEPGEALVLYTDGLVESGKDIIEGEENLRRHLRELIGTPADEMAEEVLTRALADGERRDDSLVLVLRRVPAVQRCSWRIAPVPSQGSVARRESIEWLRRRGVARAVLADLELIASELLSNAVAAARTAIDLRVEISDGLVTLEVQDDGSGDPELSGRGVDLPADLSEAGRGLFLVRSLSSDVSTISTEDGSLVRASVGLDQPRGQPEQHEQDLAEMQRPHAQERGYIPPT